MQKKQLKIITVLLLGLGLTEVQAQTMYVKESNGTESAYALNNVQKMTFSSGNISIHKTDNTTGAYALSGLKYLSFTAPESINEQQMQAGNVNNLIAYPNPATNVLNIDLTNTKNEGGSISILTLDGKVMQTQKTSATNVETLNLSRLPQGIYLCCYAGKTEIRTVKIIKQ